MQSTAQVCSPHAGLDCAMVEAITPESITDGVSTEELDENLCSTISPGLSEELVDHGLCKLENRLGSAIHTSTGYSPPSSALSPTSLDKNTEKKWSLVKVRVGFDVTRKGERSLVIDGYKFTKSRDGMGDRVFWRCSRRECKATAVTVSDRVEHIRALHSHQPPVAAEFFAENNTRCEQEVRFNNATACPRSRVRRRSQPALGGHPQWSHKLGMTDASEVAPVTNGTPLSVEVPVSRHLSDVSTKYFEQVSPETTPNQPCTVSVNGFAARTLTALITHLVESNSNAMSLKTHPSCSRAQIEIEEITGPDFFDTRPSTEPIQSVTDYTDNHRHASSPDGAQTNSSARPNVSDTSSLEQLAAIATSFANSTSSSSGSVTVAGHSPPSNTSVVFSRLAHQSCVINNNTSPPSSTEPATNVDQQLGYPHPRYSSAADHVIMTPGTIGFIGKNAQGQLVVLTGEQLSDLLRAQQLPHNSDVTVSISPDDSPSFADVKRSPRAASHTSSSTAEQQYAPFVSHLHTVRSGVDELQCNPTVPSDPRTTSSSLSTDQTWAQSSVSEPPPKHTDPRLNGLPKSLSSCIVSFTSKTSDAAIQPIMVTALQVQPPGSPQINPTLGTDQFESPTYYSPPSLTRRSMLAELSRPPMDLSLLAECSSSGPDHGTLNHSHFVGQAPPPPAQGKMPGHSLLVHWKKEKMRESVEEDTVPCPERSIDDDTMHHFADSQPGYDLHSAQPSGGRKRQSSMELLNEGSLSKLPCCCEDVVPSTMMSSSNCCSQPAPAYAVYHSASHEMRTRSSQPPHCPTVSNGFDEEETLCNQVQDGILVKVLNTVQQLTAKLDADADPPEVIQNCRAIQACLDTIAAIKRVRSASGGSGSPKNNNNNNNAADSGGTKSAACLDSSCDPSSVSASRARVSDSSAGCMNPPMRQLSSDSAHLLPTV